MSVKQRRVPDGWSEVTVGEITLWHKQGFYTQDSYVDEDETTVKLVRITDLGNPSISTCDSPSLKLDLKTMREFKIEKGDFLVARSGAIGRFGIADREMNAVFASYIINFRLDSTKVKTEYFGGVFDSILAQSLMDSVQGSSNKNVNAQNLKSLSFLLPPLPEQEKIASILSDWDDSLSTLARLIEAKRQQKRGLAEQLLTGKRRLAGFTGEWERKRFGDVFSRVTRKNTEGNEHALTISGTLGLIDQKEFFNKRVAASDLSGYYLIRRGEFAYNKSYSAGYDFGAIKRLNRYDAGVVSTLYICFALTEISASSDFYEHFFEANLLNEEISGIAQEGARNHGLLNVSVKDFFELEVPFPNPEEQKAIAGLLTTFDAEISSLSSLHSSLLVQKRGLMEVLLTGRVRVPLPGVRAG